MRQGSAVFFALLAATLPLVILTYMNLHPLAIRFAISSNFWPPSNTALSHLKFWFLFPVGLQVLFFRIYRIGSCWSWYVRGFTRLFSFADAQTRATFKSQLPVKSKVDVSRPHSGASRLMLQKIIKPRRENGWVRTSIIQIELPVRNCSVPRIRVLQSTRCLMDWPVVSGPEHHSIAELFSEPSVLIAPEEVQPGL